MLPMHSWLVSIVHLNDRYFKSLSSPSGAWSIATIEVALRAGNGTQANNMYNDSYKSHDIRKGILESHVKVLNVVLIRILM